MKTETLAVAIFTLSALGCTETPSVTTTPLLPGEGVVRVLDNQGPEGDTGWWPSVVFDRHDVPHISFCDAQRGDLRYATKVGGQWRVTTALSQGNVGKYTSVAVDSQGRVAIAFYDQDQKLLRYARRPLAKKGEASSAAGTAPWPTERVAWGLEIGFAAELRFDDNDEAHLFYYLPSGRLAHAHRKSDGRWRKEVVAVVTGSFTVRIDPKLRADGFWLTYVDWNFRNTRLLLASPVGTGAAARPRIPLSEQGRLLSKDVQSLNLGPSRFHKDVVSTRKSPGWRSQLFFGPAGQPIVMYTSSLNGQLRLTERRVVGDVKELGPFERDRDYEALWHDRMILEHVGNFAASRLSDGSYGIAYEDITRSKVGEGLVRYARLRQGTLTRHAFDHEGPSGEYLDMAVNSRGQAIVVYYAKDIRGIRIYDESTPEQGSRP